MLSVCFCSNFKDQSIFKSRKKSKYVAYLNVLQTIQIASQVNTKTTTTTTTTRKKQTKDNTYTLRGYLMPSKLGETLMSHLKRPSLT